jgi:hypothetical protein
MTTKDCEGLLREVLPVTTEVAPRKKAVRPAGKATLNAQKSGRAPRKPRPA